MWANNFSSAPLGVLYLASIARMHGHQVRCVDLLVENLSRKGFTSLLDDFAPDVVGLTVYTESAFEAMELGHMARERGATVLVGGAHATFVPRDVLESGLGDYVVRFEGEPTFIELLTYLEHGAPPRESIRGLAYLDSEGRFVATATRPHIKCLDGIPFPAVDGLPVRVYTCPLVCLTSRGCPGRCLFCLSPPMHGTRYRAHSLNRVVSEVYSLAKRYPDLTVAFIDDIFTLDRDRLYGFLRAVRTLLPQLTWSCYSRVDALDRETIALMADAGCVGIQLGIETGDQAVSDSINKRISLDHAEEIVGLIEEHGIMPLCSLIIGHHSDTKESVGRTLAFGRRLAKKYHAFVTFALCSPFPGSPIYRRCRRLGVELHTKDWSEFLMTEPFVSTSHLSQDDLRELYFESSAGMVLNSELRDYWQPVLAERLSARGSRAGVLL